MVAREMTPVSSFRLPTSDFRLPMGSAALHEEAKRVLVGGVNSPVRAFRAVGQEPIILERGKGAMVTDADGTRFIDLIMGWGALILGHAHPALVRAVRQRIADGAHLGLTHQGEVELARAVTEAIPSIEQVRFTASGTEACMTAVRLARAHTGRAKMLTFEGCYHGHSDGLLVKRSAGVPETLVQDTLVAPYQDREAVEAAFTQFGGQIAAVILEPVAANMGVVVPDRAFLRRLRELATQHGALLIFDEVVTGFRLAYGGAQALLGATPDLTILGKIIGGGFPIGAVGGRRDVMQRLAPDGGVYHAGTFAGHPVAMTAGLATLQELRRTNPYERLESLGIRLADGLRQAAKSAGVPVQVNRAGSMLTVFFSEKPVTDFASAKASQPTQFAAWANGLRQHGVLIPPSQCEALFLSTAHTAAMGDRIAAVASRVLKGLFS